MGKDQDFLRLRFFGFSSSSSESATKSVGAERVINPWPSPNGRAKIAIEFVPVPTS